MGDGLKRLGSRILYVGEAETAAGRSLLHERYKALQRQIPLLYAIVIANVLGLTLAMAGEIDPFAHPASLIGLLVLYRLWHWVRTRKRTLPPERIIVELRKTLILSVVFSVAYCFWGLSLYAEGGENLQNYVILFGSLASIGCAYALSSFMKAGRVPLILLGLPLAIRLLLSGHAAHIGMGVSLVLIVLLTLRLLNLHDWGFTQIVQSRSDIAAERERARAAERIAVEEQRRVKKVADTDPLTGLANRRAFLNALSDAQARIDEPGPGLTLALVDLDGFKPINDTFGHAAGDAVLTEVSRRLTRIAAGHAIVARIGGDEFALLFRSRNDAAALKTGSEICQVLQRPYHIDGRVFQLSGSCGLTLHQPGCAAVGSALSRADMALYSAKQEGRARVALFSPAMEAVARRRAQIERALRDPKVHDQMELVFQPIIDIRAMELRGFEALARWNHPELGSISPAEFIPVTEQINVIEAIGDSLLAKAAAEASRWPDSLFLSFNLSAVQLCSANSAEKVLAIVAEKGLDPSRLQVEVTETALLVDFETARSNLNILRNAGTRIALDDFGAGYASISYLREIDFDAVKLDGTLVTDAASSDPARRLLKGVLDLCSSIGVYCVAEHVEHAGQLAVLQALGCGYGQGYLLSKPLNAVAAGKLAGPRPSKMPQRKRAAA